MGVFVCSENTTSHIGASDSVRCFEQFLHEKLLTSCGQRPRNLLVALTPPRVPESPQIELRIASLFRFNDAKEFPKPRLHVLPFRR